MNLVNQRKPRHFAIFPVEGADVTAVQTKVPWGEIAMNAVIGTSNFCSVGSVR